MTVRRWLPFGGVVTPCAELVGSAPGSTVSLLTDARGWQYSVLVTVR